MPKRALGDANGRNGTRDVGKTKAPERVSSGRNSSMFKGYVNGGSFVKWKSCVDSMASRQVASAVWLPARWLPQTGFPGFRKRIQHAKIVIPQAFDNKSLFLRSGGRWIPPGFPGEKASR